MVITQPFHSSGSWGQMSVYERTKAAFFTALVACPLQRGLFCLVPLCLLLQAIATTWESLVSGFRITNKQTNTPKPLEAFIPSQSHSRLLVFVCLAV